MIRFGLRAASLLTVFIVGAAVAQTTAIQDVTPQPTEPRPIEDRRLPGTAQASGDARWNTELARQVYSLCPGEVIVEVNGRRAEDCARNSLMVRNDSKMAIQCKALLEYAKPDHSGDTHLEVDRVIPAMAEDAVLSSYADASNMPQAYSANCVAIPTGPLAPLGNPPDCRTSFQGPSPDDFYPPSSRRRDEQGSVVLEFTVTADTVPAEVRVAASSGFAELDTAALNYAKHLRAQGSCVGTRSRVKVRFTIG
jgi:TonB family protein